METKEQKEARLSRAMEKIKKILDEEQCELEPFVLISSGVLIKKEINIIAKNLQVENQPQSLTTSTSPVEGGS